jgi:hypothetical protein
MMPLRILTTIVVVYLAFEPTTALLTPPNKQMIRRRSGVTSSAARSTSRRSRQQKVWTPFAPFFFGNDGGVGVSSVADTTVSIHTKITTTLTESSSFSSCPLDRFQRHASSIQHFDRLCILTISGSRYNMTAWANSHPGGAKVLERFHGRDASKAFEAVGHSPGAYAMLKEFLIVDRNNSLSQTNNNSISNTFRWRQRLRQKLFTHEDPVGIHKYLGLFCLLNFVRRFWQMYFGDPAAGLGQRGHACFSMICLLPHALLSLSSLIFQTVPKERVVGKPMIWQEYRIHNIVFGVRSVLTALVASLAVKLGNTPTVRKVAILASGACVLLANWGADRATVTLRVVEAESTTATMPYWKGCSVETQKKFKGFYAYCQFMATLACLACGNPAWPLAVLIAIQLASLLMTLVRKGLLSARGYHYGYTASLVAPYFVGFRSMLYSQSFEFPVMLVLGYTLYQLRRRGVNKYALWVPVIVGRLLVGDMFINYSAW